MTLLIFGKSKLGCLSRSACFCSSHEPDSTLMLGLEGFKMILRVTAAQRLSCKFLKMDIWKNRFEVAALSAKYEGKESTKEQGGSVQKSRQTLGPRNNDDPSVKGNVGYRWCRFRLSDDAGEHSLSYSGLDEFKEPEFKGYGSENSKQESNIVCDQKLDDSKENSDDSLVKEQVSKDTSRFVESSLNVDKETIFPVDKKVESVKPKNHEKPVKKSVRLSANTIKGKGWASHNRMTHDLFTVDAQALTET
ncbi:hypothetical protein Tco_1465153 [Tanacetum coccineum]